MAMRSGSGEVPYGVQAMLGGPYLYIGQPERAVDWCRTQLARGPDTHVFTRAALVLTLRLAGCADDAMAAAKGLIEAAEATPTRMRSRSRFSPTAWPSATPIPTARVTPCAGA
jgi:hypothetical protein